MIKTEKLFETIGISPLTTAIRYEYDLNNGLDDISGKPVMFSGITDSLPISKKEMHNEKAYLNKSIVLLKRIRDTLQKEIDEIENFKGWYEA